MKLVIWVSTFCCWEVSITDSTSLVTVIYLNYLFLYESVLSDRMTLGIFLSAVQIVQSADISFYSAMVVTLHRQLHMITYEISPAYL